MVSLRLSHQQVQQITDHCLTNLPNEACGLIAGDRQRAHQIIPITNVATNPRTHYQLDAQEQLQALKVIETQGLNWIAVFHSHPNGAPLPSQDDIREASLNTPNLVHVIVGLKNNKMRLQAWQLHHHTANPVELVINKQIITMMPPMSKLQIWAALLSIVLGITLLLAISFSLLPPAPPIPTPQ